MTKILMVGDTHGNENHLNYVCEQTNLNDCERIFQVGDWGFLWPGKRDGFKALHDILDAHGQKMWFIDGNHESFSMLEEFGAVPSNDTPIYLSDIVTYIPRGLRWEWDGVKFLSCGGAFSIDLPSRTPMISWWPQEEITEADVIRSVQGGPVDIMITHDAPNCPPKLASMLQMSEEIWIRAYGANRWYGELSPRSFKCRQAISAIMDEVTPKLLIHGHYHWRYDDELNGTRIVGLNCDGTGSESWMVLDTSDFEGKDG